MVVMVGSSQKHQIRSKAITKLSKNENFNENLFLSPILHPCLQALKSLKPMRPLKPLKPLNPLQFIKDIKAIYYTEAFKASKAFKSPKNFTLVKIALPRAWRLKAFSVLFFVIIEIKKAKTISNGFFTCPIS